MQASGPYSVVELAALTGRAPDSLYFHIRKLLKLGLLREVAVRRSGRRDETVYDVSATSFRLEKANIEPDSGVPEIIEAAIKLATRDLRRVVEGGNAIAQGPK
jgi:DNA-binding transcriptional ArsR family regulator